MASSKGRAIRAIPLFSEEANALLREASVAGRGGAVVEAQGGAEEDGEQRERFSQARGGGDASCLCCQVSFSGRQEQVEHYKLDWHRYNIKRRLKDLEPVDQTHFERLAGDLSSISGSESDSDSDHTPSDDEQPASKEASSQRDLSKSPYLHFSSSSSSSSSSPTTSGGPTHSVYRCIVSSSPSPHSSSEQESDHKELTRALQALGGEPQVWILLMRSGGHFAGAIFKGALLVAHKTFHRYTVRAKRGTAQSIRDSQQGGHQPKSAGANLRRYNEAALISEVRDLLNSWSAHINESCCVFVRLPKHSRGVLIGERGDSRTPLQRGDPRLRPIPFPTRRPTLKEVRATHARLAAVYVGVVGGEGPGRPASGKKKGISPVKSGVAASQGKALGAGLPNKGPHPCTLPGSAGSALRSDPDTTTTTVIDVDGTPDATDTTSAQVSSAKTKKRKKDKKKPTAPPPPPPPPPPLQGLPEFVQQLVSICDEIAISNTTTAVGDQVTNLLESVGLVQILKKAEEEEEEEEREKGVSEEKSGVSDAGSLKLLNTLWNGATLLHTAAAKGCASLIPVLMLHGADPAVKNASGQTPYLVAKNKDVRDAFRRFMAEFPKGYDYEHAHVPSPLTPHMEKERRQKEAEKRKEKKKAKKQREQERQCEQTQQQAVASLSDREKRALAAEKRMANQTPNSSFLPKAGTCNGCGQSLVGVVPFERLDYKYCSMECLKLHRKQLAQ